MRRSVRQTSAGALFRSLIWAGGIGTLLCAAPQGVCADVVSDAAAAILVFPKIVVDVATPQIAPPLQIDTLVRISNTSDKPIFIYCFLVNATPHCINGSGSCLSSPITCTPRSDCQTEWQERDFVAQITARQPIAWLASHGESICEGPPGGIPAAPCLPLSQTTPFRGPNGQTNDGSLIVPVPEDPFIGELKCLAIDANGVPVERNDLKGEAEIVRSNPGFVDVEGYNAIGIPSVPGTNNGDNVLTLGGAAAEYSGCPNFLILDHFFDGAQDPVSGRTVTTDLTLVPCSEDFSTQSPITTTAQFLLFNEFEQRLSTSRPVTCFEEFHLFDIDRSTTDRSIFSAAVQGTLTGQTRIRGVADADQTHGHALLGIAEEFRDGGGTAAFNLHYDGSRPQSDFVYLP